MSEIFNQNNDSEKDSEQNENLDRPEVQGNQNISENQQEKLRNLMPDYSPQFSLWDYRIGFGRRFGASLLDMLFASIITGILYYATGTLTEIMEMGFAAFMDPEFMIQFARDTVPISLLVSAIYFSTEILLSGTPGKHILGIIIADSEMVYASYGKLTFRFLIKHFDLIFLGVYILTWQQIFSTISSAYGWLVFFAFLAVFRASREALYDSICKTAVYYKKEVDSNQESKSVNNFNQM
jgi:uncharacterized RDD family membrane protein YckC